MRGDDRRLDVDQALDVFRPNDLTEGRAGTAFLLCKASPARPCPRAQQAAGNQKAAPGSSRLGVHGGELGAAVPAASAKGTKKH